MLLRVGCDLSLAPFSELNEDLFLLYYLLGKKKKKKLGFTSLIKYRDPGSRASVFDLSGLSQIGHWPNFSRKIFVLP